MQIRGSIKGDHVQLDPLSEKDLPHLWEIIYCQEHPEWRKWQSPFNRVQPMKYEKFRDQMLNLLKQGLEKRLLIKVEDEVIGVVFYQWEHESSNSIEVGVEIYHRDYHDIAFEIDALRTWMNYLFDNYPLPRIGLTTWSGNERMIQVGREIGMVIEGRIRKSRLFRGKYYDSIKLGILQEEWEDRKNSH